MECLVEWPVVGWAPMMVGFPVGETMERKAWLTARMGAKERMGEPLAAMAMKAWLTDAALRDG